jgi:CheY-like chemotaxis protein
MDYQMPEVDGYEATEMIRHSGKTYSQIPIIALTANAFPSDRDKCLKTGMNAYVSKPFDKTELLIAIETHGALTKE